MSFASILNEYCNLLPYSGKEIASTCGISESALSRYRGGERIPSPDSPVIAALSEGIAVLMKQNDVQSPLAEPDIRFSLISAQNKQAKENKQFTQRLDALMTATHVRNAELATMVDVDPSYISRIRHNTRAPRMKRKLAQACAALAAHACLYNEALDVLPSLDGIAINDVSHALSQGDPRVSLTILLFNWLLGTDTPTVNANDLLRALHLINQFNYEETEQLLTSDPYWDRVLSQRSQQHETSDTEDSRFYYGLEASRKAELDFLYEVLASEESKTITLYSNLPSEEIASDAWFLARHRSGLMRFLKEGGTITIIHSLFRPFSEILTGLEYWLPLYLTGRVKTYFMPQPQEAHIKLLTHVSEKCALSAEDLYVLPNARRYHLVKNPEEVSHCRHKTQVALDNAKPLFTLYRPDQPERYKKYNEERALRAQTAATPGIEVLEGRFESLRIVSYGSTGSVVALMRPPYARAVIHSTRINAITAHLDAILKSHTTAL